MAPPAKRRPGFSRRAQYGLFASYVVAVAGLLIAIGLVLAARFDPAGFRVIRGAALEITAPFSSATRSIMVGGRSAWQEIAAYFNAASQNRAMRQELERARGRLIEARALRLENAQLKRTLQLAESIPDRVAAARLVSTTTSGGRRIATMAAGTSSGVRVGQPVRAPEGLVGRIINAGPHYAHVLLLTDGANTVPVRLVRGGLPALATGIGDGRLEIRSLISGQSPFKRGDLLLTSGTGGVYPPNVPVAVVIKVTPDGAVGVPLADPARVDFAIIEKIFQPPPPQLAPAPSDAP